MRVIEHLSNHAPTVFLVSGLLRACMRLMVSTALVLLFLSGCSTASSDENSDSNLRVEPVGDTAQRQAQIQGMVVDWRIAPLPGAIVSAAEAQVVTNEDGMFTLGGLEAGQHQIHVSKAGYIEVALTVNASRPDENPEYIKIILEPNSSATPYFIPLAHDGFISCSFKAPLYRFAACALVADIWEVSGEPPIVRDDYYSFFEIDRDPWFVQAELVWDSTQPAGDSLYFVVEPKSTSPLVNKTGISPLVVRADRASINASGMNALGQIQHRVFSGENSATRPPIPVCGIPEPLTGGTHCIGGVGATIEQDYQLFSFVFYGFEPDPEWTFFQHGQPGRP